MDRYILIIHAYLSFTMSRFQKRKAEGSYNNTLNNYYSKNKFSKQSYGDKEVDRRPSYFEKNIRGNVFRGLHIIFTVGDNEKDIEWLKDFGVIESIATHTGCDRGGLHMHALLLAHCRKDKTII